MCKKFEKKVYSRKIDFNEVKKNMIFIKQL